MTADRDAAAAAVDRRSRADARDEARGVLLRLGNTVREHHGLYTLAELKAIGAGEEALRQFIKRMDRS